MALKPTEKTVKIKLGQRVRDTLSGFEGVAFGITDYLYGCRHICIKPTELNKDGEPAKIQWVDEPQCEVVKVVKKVAPVGNTGGPREDNPRKG